MNEHVDHAAELPKGSLDTEFLRHIAGRALCIPYDRSSGAVLSLASRPNAGSFHWLPASGQAHLRSFTVVWPSGRSASAEPHLVAWVELAEGPRLISTTCGIPRGELRVGLPLCARFDDDGLLVFVAQEPVPMKARHDGKEK